MDSRKKYGAEQWMAIYNTVYTLCTQKPPYIYADQLYLSIKETETQYLRERVLPNVKSLHDEFKLKELIHRWENHKVMVCLSFWRHVETHSVLFCRCVGFEKFLVIWIDFM